MSNTNADMETKGHQAQVEDVYDSDEKTRYADMKADAIEAENAEHSLGVIAAVKGYPMAATWAFIISCTIVSRMLLSVCGKIAKFPFRLWKLTACSSWATSSPCPHSQTNTASGV